MTAPPQIPEIRTSREAAIAATAATVIALAISVTLGDQLSDALRSSSGAVAVLAVWCLTGAGASIAGIVDAYIRPEGERLALGFTIAATVFAVVALLVVVGIVVGGTGVVDSEISLGDEPS